MTSQGVVDIQLKALQAILVILTIGPIHASLLGDASPLARDRPSPLPPLTRLVPTLSHSPGLSGLLRIA